MTEELAYQQSSILELMKLHTEALKDQIAVLDHKAELNIGVSSIILGIVSALNLGQGKSPTETFFFACALVVYAVAFLLSFLALTPRTWPTYPLSPTWEEAINVLEQHKALDDYFHWLLSSYAKVMEEAEKPRNRKAFFVQLSTLLVGIDVLCIVLAKVLG